MERLSSTDVQATNRDSSRVGSVVKPACSKLLMRTTTTTISLVESVRIFREFFRMLIVDVDSQ